jgi:hypothetical protein
MVPVQQSGTVIMSLLTEDQLNNIVMMIVENNRFDSGEYLRIRNG